MPSASTIIKAATSVLAASAALIGAFKDNPQLAGGAKTALDAIRRARDSNNPKLRFEAKLAAIEACADAVELQFPGAAEVASWRQTAAALRMRGELAWETQGRRRRATMKALNRETADLLARINERLAQLTPEVLLEGTQREVEGGA